MARRALKPAGAPATVFAVATVAERLGASKDARMLIVGCAGLGSAFGANVSVFRALRSGAATTATLMVPAPWSRGAAASYRGEDVGVMITLNAEHDLYRWGPITHAPSLLDGEGGFPRTVADLWDHADLDEVRREARAQLERAIYWGFDVSHIGVHLDAVSLKPEFFDAFLDLAEEFSLPLRLPDAPARRSAGFPLGALAAERKVCSPDRVVSSALSTGLLPAISVPTKPGGPSAPDPGWDFGKFEEFVRDLEPGVTELCLCPSADSDELRAAASDAARRVADDRLLAAAGELRAVLEREGVTPIGYRALRDLARAG